MPPNTRASSMSSVISSSVEYSSTTPGVSGLRQDDPVTAGAECTLEYLAGGTARSGVPGPVARVTRCLDQRDVRCIRLGVLVAIRAARGDRGFGPPEVIVVLRFHQRDGEIVQRQVQQREGARILRPVSGAVPSRVGARPGSTIRRPRNGCRTAPRSCDRPVVVCCRAHRSPSLPCRRAHIASCSRAAAAANGSVRHSE